jgi:hypothetical protein
MNDSVAILYIVGCRTTDERINGKDLDGSGRGLIKALSHNLPGGCKEITKILSG